MRGTIRQTNKLTQDRSCIQTNLTTIPSICRRATQKRDGRGLVAQVDEHTEPTWLRILTSEQIAPTLAMTERFHSTDLKTFSRLVQCRTEHAHMGEYCSQFVSTQDTKCACGKDRQHPGHHSRMKTICAAQAHNGTGQTRPHMQIHGHRKRTTLIR